MARVGIVLAVFDAARAATTLRHLAAIRRALPPSTLVVVSNNPALTPSVLGLDGEEARSYVAHDNTGLEFGAYQAGLDRLRGKADADWTVVANDTFSTNRPFAPTARRAFVGIVGQARADAAVCGRVEQTEASYDMAGHRTHRWVTTNLFALSRAAVASLQGKVYWPTIDRWITGSSSEETFFSGDVDPVLRDHLRMWLFGSVSGPRWFRAAPLDPTTAPRLASKARSILQEKFLAAVLEAAGTSFIDLKAQPFATLARLKLEERILRAWHGIA